MKHISLVFIIYFTISFIVPCNHGNHSNHDNHGNHGNHDSHDNHSNHGSIQQLLRASLNKDPPESLKRIRKLEYLKTDILRKLRLETAPDITKTDIPDLPSLQAQVRQVEEEAVVQGADGMAAGSKLFRLGEAVPGKSSIVFFNLTTMPLPSPSSIHRAVFCVYVKKTVHEHPYRRTVLFVHDGGSTELLTRHEIKFRETDTWVYIDLTSKVRQWLSSPERNHGVEVTCVDNVGASLVLLHAPDQADRYSVPVLEIELSNSTLQRRKRQSKAECEEFPTGEKCCRYPLVVDFSEFGWNYIIAPKTINIYVCKGECPIFNADHPHSILTNSNLCCAPKLYSHISIIYFDHNKNIIVGKVPGLAVKKCYCI